MSTVMVEGASIPIGCGGSCQRPRSMASGVAAGTTVSGPPCRPHEGADVMKLAATSYAATAHKAVSAIAKRFAWIPGSRQAAPAPPEPPEPVDAPVPPPPPAPPEPVEPLLVAVVTVLPPSPLSPQPAAAKASAVSRCWAVRRAWVCIIHLAIVVVIVASMEAPHPRLGEGETRTRGSPGWRGLRCEEGRTVRAGTARGPPAPLHPGDRERSRRSRSPGSRIILQRNLPRCGGAALERLSLASSGCFRSCPR